MDRDGIVEPQIEPTEDIKPQDKRSLLVLNFKGRRATPEKAREGLAKRQARIEQGEALLRQLEESVRIREMIQPDPSDEMTRELASRNILVLDARTVEPTHARLASMVWGVAAGSWEPDKSQMEGLKLMARLYAADSGLEAARESSGSIRELATSIRAMLGRK